MGSGVLERAFNGVKGCEVLLLRRHARGAARGECDVMAVSMMGPYPPWPLPAVEPPSKGRQIRSKRVSSGLTQTARMADGPRHVGARATPTSRRRVGDHRRVHAGDLRRGARMQDRSVSVAVRPSGEELQREDEERNREPTRRQDGM